MSASEIRQVKAGAGSGKTHALTRRFLSLLHKAGRTEHRLVCSASPITGFSWPEILAATFTNKAAAEMKERVVSALKLRALGAEATGPEDSWRAGEAEAMLQAILRRYHRLNIRTIDSLLVQLLRLLSLEYGLPPDFELALDGDEIFNAVFDSFLALCEEDDGPERGWLIDAIAGMLRHEGRKGFRLERGIRERIREILPLLRHAGPDLLLDPAALGGLLQPSHGRATAAAESLLAMDEVQDLAFNAHFKNFLGKCRDLKVFDAPPESAYAQKPDLGSCCNAAGKDKVTEHAEALYERFKEALAQFRRDQAVAHSAYGMIPCVLMARVLGEAADNYQKMRGLVSLESVPHAVAGLLGSGQAVPEACCRFGARLHHLLLDEFQDTSRSQWQAMTPLTEECLAKGGSLFYVGDVKQAIYGWRGGDSSLFSEITVRPGPADLAGSTVLETLPANWRSHRVVVEFNNDFFSGLEDPEHAQTLADTLMAKAPESNRHDLARAIAATFSGCRQDVAERNRGSEGYVRLQALPGAADQDRMEPSLDALEELVEDIRKRHSLKDMAVLVREGRQAAAVCERLMGRGIPVVTETSLLLARHPVVRQIIALLRFLEYPADDLSFLAFVTGPDVFLGAAGISAAEVTDWVVGQTRHPLWNGFASCFSGPWEHLVAPFLGQSGLMSPYDTIREVAGRFTVLARCPDSELYVRRLLEVAHLAEENGQRSLSAFLNFWQEQAEEEKVPLPENIDAVQVLTIHKAKGLEFPVVLLPFLDWSMRPPRSLTLARLKDRTVVAELRRGMGQAYYEAKASDALEQLHLLYVALTRAREELYMLRPAQAGGGGASPALAALELLLPMPPGCERLEWGRLPRAKTAAPTAREDQKQPPVPPRDRDILAWLPRLRVFRHSLDEDGAPERRRGEIAHRAIELLRPTGRDEHDARRALALAMQEYVLTDREAESLRQDIQPMLLWVLGEGRVSGLLRHGKSEVEMLDEEGQAMRCDCLALQQGCLTVLEFKTGGPQAEHPLQVRRYLSVLSAVYPQRKARGLLVYLDQRRIEEVEP